MNRVTVILGALTAVVALLGGLQWVVNEWRMLRWRKQQTGKWFLVAWLCLLPSLADAACSGSSPTWTAADASYTEVAACVTASSAGDTINVPAGSATWASTLTISKNISLIGAGIGSTVITIGTSLAIDATPTNSTTNLFRISGFTFTTSGTEQWLDITQGNVNPPVTKVRIDHNRCDGTSSKTGSCIIHGSIRGVIDNNQFATARPMRAFKGGDEGAYDWTTYGPMSMGTADNLYFEDNTIDFTSTDAGGYMVSDGFDGCRYVYRYNNLTGSGGGTWPFFDWHGHNGTSYSCFAGEIYGNKFLSEGNMVSWRGGKARIFLNQGTTSTGIAIYSQQACPNANEKHNDGYIWGNRLGASGTLTAWSTPSSGGDVCGDVRDQQGTTFWTEYTQGALDDIGTFTTDFMSSGTLAARPSTCTTGVGYWATDQSTSSLTNLVGVNPSTPISGTLYKCTSTDTWTSHYTPYTYPHPLRSGVSESGSLAFFLRFVPWVEWITVGGILWQYRAAILTGCFTTVVFLAGCAGGMKTLTVQSWTTLKQAPRYAAVVYLEWQEKRRDRA